MNAIPPLAFHWDGDAMSPKLPKLADKFYVVGEVYRLAPHEERSAVSHRHYFASINEAHNNLPEEIADRLPTPEHLRKFALIKAGYCEARPMAFPTKGEAMKAAAFIRPIDDFAVVDVDGVVVTVYTAKSQSMRAMGKKVFQKSKEAVLQVIAELIGTDPTTLKQSRAA